MEQYYFRFVGHKTAHHGATGLLGRNVRSPAVSKYVGLPEHVSTVKSDKKDVLEITDDAIHATKEFVLVIRQIIFCFNAFPHNRRYAVLECLTVDHENFCNALC